MITDWIGFHSVLSTLYISFSQLGSWPFCSERKSNIRVLRAAFLTEHDMLLIMVDSATIRFREKFLKLVVHGGIYRQTPDNKGRNFVFSFKCVFTSELEIALSLVKQEKSCPEARDIKHARCIFGVRYHCFAVVSNHSNHQSTGIGLEDSLCLRMRVYIIPVRHSRFLQNGANSKTKLGI